MIAPLWLWTPGGIPLHSHIERGAKIEKVPANNGVSGNARLIISDNGAQIECDLAPEYDWLPRRVVLSGSRLYEAKRFAKTHGYWFPMEILDSVNDTNPNHATRFGFRVLSLKINNPIDPTYFNHPPIPDGAIVFDETGGGVGVPKGVKGGIRARQKLVDSNSKPAVPAGSRVPSAEAPRDPARFPWAVTFLLLSLPALALALVLKVGRIVNRTRAS